MTIHREAFSKSRAELARCETEVKNLSKERDDLKILYVKKDEEISDLRAKLAKARQVKTKLIEKQKGKLVEQLRKEIKMKEAETLGWKQGLDHLALEKDTLREQLTLIEHQLQSVKEESLARSCKIEELEAKSVAVLAKAKSDEERETLEEVHARGFNLLADIEKAKSLEEEVAAFLSDDDDSASDIEIGGDEDEIPEEEVPEDVAPEDAAPEGVAPK
ncbi:uncharacterized protein [Nicotiana sylvestris]|uniref:uncharacterized protein n=1 Tax=Nicotiana sylvestris TaxID=4096 RepID=UPI00388C7811